MKAIGKVLKIFLMVIGAITTFFVAVSVITLKGDFVPVVKTAFQEGYSGELFERIHEEEA